MKHQPGADPGAVAYDAYQFARARNLDVLLVDTAGRLHTKTPLMDELGKVRRVIEKEGKVQEALLVIDATAGQNGLVQAREFAQAAGVTGVVLTKLDGTAKGGIALAIEETLGIPIKLIGVGEGDQRHRAVRPQDVRRRAPLVNEGSVNPSTIVVAGATGFLGRHIAKALVDGGHKVIALGRDPQKAASVPELEGLEARRGDVTDPSSLTGVLEGADAVVGAVQFPNHPIEVPRKGLTYDRYDRQGTENLIEEAKRAGVKRYVYLSGAGARVTSDKTWYRAKGLAERAIEDSGLEYAIVRPSWAYGPEDRALNRFASDGSLPPGDPATRCATATRATRVRRRHRSQRSAGSSRSTTRGGRPSRSVVPAS